jgi:hypothetical protein
MYLANGRRSTATGMSDAIVVNRSSQNEMTKKNGNFRIPNNVSSAMTTADLVGCFGGKNG